mmetsp:Transcript_9197/g.13801  ORF Transcript_9197/g.13801 Transcript_9197/m.13801 type:complete len:999 (+) Transcript_9197:58-3054(+)
MIPPAAKRVRVDYDFKDDSQDSEVDMLELKAGDILTVLEESEEEGGWWRGRTANGKEGFFPITYCSVIEEEPTKASPPPPPVPSEDPKNSDDALIPPVGRMGSNSVSAVSTNAISINALSANGPSPQSDKKSLIVNAPILGVTSDSFTNSRDGLISSNPNVASLTPASRPPKPPTYNKASISILRKKGIGAHRRQASMEALLRAKESKTPKRGDRKARSPQIDKKDVMKSIIDKGYVSKKAGYTILDDKVKIPTQFFIWAHNMAIIASLFCLVLGFCALAWGAIDDKWGLNHGILGTYSVALGIYIVLFEKFFGTERQASALPKRGFMYFILGFPLFFTYPTVLAGIFVWITASVHCVSAFYEEEIKAPRKRKKAKAAPIRRENKTRERKSSFGNTYRPLMVIDGVELLEPEPTLWDNLKAWIIFLRNSSKLGEKVFLLVYIVLNVLFFLYAVVLWVNLNQELDEEDRISSAGPFAKGFGWTLDFNCALILIPVCRNLLSIMYDISSTKSFIGGCCGVLVTFIPLDRNIAFHKFVAYVMCLCAFGHMFFHFINYALRPDQTIDLFGIVPWYTGGFIMLCIFMIFSGAQLLVRRKQFEIFWYTHVFIFPLFFFTILIHGNGGWNPNFWKWFILPLLLYLTERFVTIRRARKEVSLVSATIMKPNVFSIELAKSGPFAMKPNNREPYSEGQYCFINCPQLSRFEWHPFTISSAPSDKTVTFHIRRSVPGSWTDKLQKFLMSLGTPNGGRIDYFHNEGAARKAGRVMGPGGLPLLKIDGPHSAPTQHITKYRQVMVVGAGIGVTPVASSCKSVVFHKWRTAVGKVFPHHGYFYWVCSHRDIDSFRWLIRLVKECQDEVSHQKSTAAWPQDRRFEFHIFITSVPKNAKNVMVQVPKHEDVSFWGRKVDDTKIEKKKGPFTEAQLYGVLKCPADLQQMGDVYVHRGRPNWKAEFQRVKEHHPKTTVGIAFCGNHFIAKDLKRYSMQFSNVEEDQLFRLHLENF